MMQLVPRRKNPRGKKESTNWCWSTHSTGQFKHTNLKLQYNVLKNHREGYAKLYLAFFGDVLCESKLILVKKRLGFYICAIYNFTVAVITHFLFNFCGKMHAHNFIAAALFVGFFSLSDSYQGAPLFPFYYDFFFKSWRDCCNFAQKTYSDQNKITWSRSNFAIVCAIYWTTM